IFILSNVIREPIQVRPPWASACHRRRSRMGKKCGLKDGGVYENAIAERPQLSDPAHGTQRWQPRRSRRVRCSAWLNEAAGAAWRLQCAGGGGGSLGVGNIRT